MIFSQYGDIDNIHMTEGESFSPRGGAVAPNPNWKPMNERSQYAQKKEAKRAAQHSQLIESILHSQKMARLSNLF